MAMRNGKGPWLYCVLEVQEELMLDLDAAGKSGPAVHQAMPCTCPCGRLCTRCTWQMQQRLHLLYTDVSTRLHLAGCPATLTSNA